MNHGAMRCFTLWEVGFFHVKHGKTAGLDDDEVEE